MSIRHAPATGTLPPRLAICEAKGRAQPRRRPVFDACASRMLALGSVFSWMLAGAHKCPRSADGGLPASEFCKYPASKSADRRGRASDHDRLVRENIELDRERSSPFKEEKREKADAEMLRSGGHQTRLKFDRRLCHRPAKEKRGAADGSPVPLTSKPVFPEGTNVHGAAKAEAVRARRGATRGRWRASRHHRAMEEWGIQTTSDILFLGWNCRRRRAAISARHEVPVPEWTVQRQNPNIYLADPFGGGERHHDGRHSPATDKKVIQRPPRQQAATVLSLGNPACALEASRYDTFDKRQRAGRTPDAHPVGVIGGATVNLHPFEAWMERGGPGRKPKRNQQTGFEEFTVDAPRRSRKRKRTSRRPPKARSVEVQSSGPPLLTRAINAPSSLPQARDQAFGI